MQMQLGFELPELDRKKTQAAVEAALDKYRIFKMVTFEEREAGTTAGYSERFHGPTNVTSDQTAQIAIYNVDTPAMRLAYCEKIERAVARLAQREKLLITERYMKEDYVFDYVVFNQIFDPPISESKYYKLKWRAFYKLALILNIQVVKELE